MIPPEMNYAPKLLSLSFPSSKSVKFSWYGVVGAFSYDLYRSIDMGPFQLIASNLSEIYSFPEFTDTGIPAAKDCDILLYYSLYAVDSDRLRRSPPMIFNVTIPSKSNFSSDPRCQLSLTETSKLLTESLTADGTVLAIIISAVFLSCMSILTFAYCQRRRRMKGNVYQSRANIFGSTGNETIFKSLS